MSVGAVKWLEGTFVFLGLMGLVVLFLGIQVHSMGQSHLTTFSGYSSDYYKGGQVFVTVGGIFVVAIGFVLIAMNITDILKEAWESI